MERVELKGKGDLRLPTTAHRGGTVFLGILIAGIGIASLISSGSLPVREGSQDDALPVMFGMGVLFILFGLFVVRAGWRGIRARRRALARQRRHPHSPWYADFDWNESGIEDAMHLRWRRQLGAVPVLALFVVPANLLFIGPAPATIFPMLTVAVLDAALVAVIVHTAYLYLQDRKYPTSTLRFDRFPFAPGGTVEVRLEPVPFGSCTATLRYVEERLEWRGSGKNRSRSHVAYQLYSEPRQVDIPGHTTELPLRFELPDEPEWTTRLTGDSSVRYWELHFEAETPGIDFETSFPLPVYGTDPESIIESNQLLGPDGTPLRTSLKGLPTRSLLQAIRHDSRGLLLGLIFIAIALSVPLMIWFSSQRADEIAEHGITVTAIVLDKRTSRSSSGSKSTSYLVHYAFEVAGGSERQDSGKIAKSRWDALDPGDPLEILYEPEPPHRSMPKPDGSEEESLFSRIMLYLFIAVFVTLFSGVFAAFGIGMIYTAFKESA